VTEWYSIEVSNTASGSARTWSEAYGDVLTGIALAEGATSWSWRHEPWGSVLEIELADEAAWTRFLAVDAVKASLEAVPDPVNGLSIHPGRGGSSGSRDPRRPRPLIGSGATSVPLPIESTPQITPPQTRIFSPG
jgi:hypothetical protein